MGFGIAKSFIEKKRNIKKIILYDINEKTLKKFNKKSNLKLTTDPKQLVAKSNLIFICVKPFEITKVIESIKRTPNLHNKMFISIAAGTKLKTLENSFSNPKVQIARLMPNLPSIIGKGAGGVCFNEPFKKKNQSIICFYLELLGSYIKVKEEQINAITALSGSGPAYVALFLEALSKAGQQCGLDVKTSLDLAIKTSKGTCSLLEEQEKMTPQSLIKQVSSSKGTTANAIEILKKNKLEIIIISAVKAAFKRAKQLEKIKSN